MKSDTLALSLSRLSPQEREAYQKYMDAGKPPLSPHVEVQLYALYLNGKGCEEIVRLNPNFTLGMVVRARVEHFWDYKRDAHIAGMLDTVRERVQQTQLEAVNFACDLLSATHKFQGDKLKKYLQTGNPEELSGLGNNLSLKVYKETVELLLKLTGQDKIQKGEILHKVETEPTTVAADSVTGLSPSQASKILKILEEDGE